MQMDKIDKYNEDNYKDKGLTGLANLGNTCFMNSTLQCLSHTYEFNDFLENEEYKDKLNKEVDSLMLIEWDKLRQLMWSENCAISPGGFIKTIQKIAKIKDKQIFTGFAQNDLPEFLLFLIDCFHNSLKRRVEFNIKGKTKNSLDELAYKCYKKMYEIYKNEYSEIINLFYGCHVSQIYDVSNSNILNETPEPFFMLNLPIPNKKNPSLIECFDLYTEKERMDGENKWHNEKEDKYQVIDRQIRFFNLPHILIIDLKRFTNTMKKNRVLVDFPVQSLDLSNYIIGYDKNTYIYDLYGVCNHTGSVIGGHYTSFVKNANNKWYFFNDTSVKEVNDENKIITNNAYCLFYRKKK